MIYYINNNYNVGKLNVDRVTNKKISDYYFIFMNYAINK